MSALTGFSRSRMKAAINARVIHRTSRSGDCKEGRHADCSGFLTADKAGGEKCQCTCKRHGIKGKGR